MTSPLFLIIRFSIFLCCMNAFLHAEEIPNTDNNSLQIESKTKTVSPKCLIEGGNEDDDRKRTEVGIGEEVELTLTGKRLGDVDMETIEWVLEPENLGAIEKSDKEENKSTLTINKDITQNTTVNVRVKTSLDDEIPERASLTFDIFVPSQIKAEHSGERVEKFPQDKEKDKAGASTRLILAFHPLNVSFSNVPIIERAEDPPNFQPPHNPGNKLMWPDARNGFRHDNIGWKWPEDIHLKDLQQMKLPKTFSWACGWYVRANDKDCCKISQKPYPQDFTFEYDGTETANDAPTKGLKNIKVTITKFGCTVTRSTADEAKHFNSTSKQ